MPVATTRRVDVRRAFEGATTQEALDYLLAHEPDNYATAKPRVRRATGRVHAPAATSAEATQQALEWLQKHDPETYAFWKGPRPVPAYVPSATPIPLGRGMDITAIAGQAAVFAGVLGLAYLAGRTLRARKGRPVLASTGAVSFPRPGTGTGVYGTIPAWSMT